MDNNFVRHSPWLAMYSQELFNKEVLSAQGWKIGNLRELVIDNSTWQIKYIEVTLNKKVADEFGVKKTIGNVSLPIDTGDIQATGDVITLKISKEDLRRSIEAAKTPIESVPLPR
jgi:sporulation protein YlmC with PRC-barrel domain